MRRIDPPLSHIDSLLAASRGAAEDAPEGRPHRVAILGAGLMGVAIAATHLRHGISVVLADAVDAVLDAAAARVASELALQMAQDTVTPTPGDATQRTAELLETTNDPARLAGCDFLIETVPETPAVKEAVYAALAPHLRSEALLTTNTSTIPIERLAGSVPRPAAFCGFHFFHPVRERSLVEIVRGRQTSAATIARARVHAMAIAKTPLVVNDSPGFLVNRLLNPYLSEALEMLLEGASVRQIEETATAFGMAMGPLRILDEIGLDVTLHGGSTLFQAFPERVPVSPLLVRMVKQKRLGRKTGRGFFRYESEAPWQGKGRPDPEVEALIESFKRDEQRFSAEMIRQRLFFGMLLEGVRLVEEGVVNRPGDVDLGVVLGLGFPRDRGGLLFWGDRTGWPAVLERSAAFASLGPRYEPPELLRRMAAEDRRFFA